MNTLKQDTLNIITEFLDKINLQSKQILVVGLSSSEIIGQKIGTVGSLDAAKIIFDTIYPILIKQDIFLAVQCCEHLNRALVTSRDCANLYNLTEVNAIPYEKAGGSFAKIAFDNIENSVLVENIKAHAGIDIGQTLIGMHLKEVAVPIRLSKNKLGEATTTFARTRPKFVGGERAIYDESLI